MPKVTTTTSFSEDDQLTHTTLNSLFTNSAFHSSAVDDTTLELSSGAMRLKAAGSGNGIATSHINNDAITVALIADDAVETDQIKDANVTVAKMAVNSIDSDQYVDGSIDEEHLSNGVITGQAALTAVPSLTDGMLFSDTDDSANLKKLDFMRYLPLPRAWGVIPFSAAGSVTIAGAYNVTTSATVVSAGDVDTVEVTLSNNMSDTNYLVLATLGTSSSSKTDSNPNVNSFNRAAGSFSLGAAIGTDRVLHFIVFGTLN